MALPNIFTKSTCDQIIDRIGRLNSNTPAQWGKMNAAQMMAHCNVTYEMVYENIHQKPSGLIKLMLKFFVKNKVVNEETYPQNGRTAPQFIIIGDKNFDIEKKRLIDYINKTQQLGEAHFNNKESHSFGPLNSTEWNNMFYKHLNHHLTQFGV